MNNASNDGTVHIRGTVENVLYRSDESGYAVCDVADENGEIFTANGNMPYISVGESVDLYGKWTRHKVYGKQLSVEKIEKVLPRNTDDILRYLSSGAIKGIGPKIAMKIVERYGKDSFEVISEHPGWLAEIKGS